MADDPQLSGGLEFSQYANLVANELAEKGYVRSADPAAADLVVRLDYGVDNGREKIRSTGFYRDPFYGPYGFYPRFYVHGRFMFESKSEESRVGKYGGSAGRYLWSRYYTNK